MADALAALAARATVDARGFATATDALDRAIAELRDVDAKATLAYVLNSAAAQDLERGDLARAETRATAALDAASVVQRRNEIVLARVCLGRIALARGQRGAAQEHLQVAGHDRDLPLVLAARVTGAVDALAAAIANPPPPSPAPRRRPAPS